MEADVKTRLMNDDTISTLAKNGIYVTTFCSGELGEYKTLRNRRCVIGKNEISMEELVSIETIKSIQYQITAFIIGYSQETGIKNIAIGIENPEIGSRRMGITEDPKKDTIFVLRLRIFIDDADAVVNAQRQRMRDERAVTDLLQLAMGLTKKTGGQLLEEHIMLGVNMEKVMTEVHRQKELCRKLMADPVMTIPK